MVLFFLNPLAGIYEWLTCVYVERVWLKPIDETISI